MSFLNNVKRNETVERVDIVGGGYSPLPTGVYPFKVKQAYGIKSSRGSMGIAYTLVVADPKHPMVGREVRQTEYVTNAEGKTTYVNKRTKKLGNLKGFDLMSELAELTLGKELSELTSEEKIVNIWSAKDNKEVPTAVPMFTELADVIVYGAVEHQLVNKSEKQGDTYVDIAETRELNEVVKFMRAKDKLTALEVRSNADKAVHYENWLAKFDGVMRDKRSIKEGTGAAASAGGTPAAAASAKPAADIFAT